jgi:hypothetical protein
VDNSNSSTPALTMEAENMAAAVQSENPSRLGMDILRR